MSFGIASAVVSVFAANQQAQAAQAASEAQQQAAQAGLSIQQQQLDQQNQRYENMQKLLAPYVQAGTGALSGQQDLSGLNGPEAQQKAVDALQNSPQFEALAKQGENGILQNASATGGLRGGNVQGALANFRPAMLNDLINQRYSQYAGLSSLGQNSAAGIGNLGAQYSGLGQQNANSAAGLLQQQGQAQAGGALAQGQYAQGLANIFTNWAGSTQNQASQALPFLM